MEEKTQVEDQVLTESSSIVTVFLRGIAADI